MKKHLDATGPDRMEVFLSAAYKRIRRTTIVLSAGAAIAVSLLLGWRNGLGLAIGSLMAYINLIWLHHSSAIMTERMIAPVNQMPSKFRLGLYFAGRYVLLAALAYVILKGFPNLLLGFTVALFLPILAAIGEGIYEAIVSSNANQA